VKKLHIYAIIKVYMIQNGGFNGENEMEETEDWRNRHGNPSFEYLQSLASDGSIEAIDKLRSIAEDLDVNFSHNTPTEELVGMIRLAAKNSNDSNPNFT